MISRNSMREIVLQIIYIFFMRNDQDIDEIKEYIYSKYDLTDEDKKNIESYVYGILILTSEIESILYNFATKQDIDVIATVDKCILSIALFEMKNIDTLNIPYAVSVHEAVNLSKKFSKDSSPAFINAVLRNYLNSLNGK